MKSLEQEAEKVAEDICDKITTPEEIDLFWISALVHKCVKAGASAALRLLSEQEGREWEVEHIGSQANILISDNKPKEDLDPVGLGFPTKMAENIVKLHNATLAPLRARVRVLEEKLESERKDFCKHMNGADEKLNRYIEENKALKADNARMKEAILLAHNTDFSVLDEALNGNATLRAQLGDLELENNEIWKLFVALVDDVRAYEETGKELGATDYGFSASLKKAIKFLKEYRDLELQKKGQGDE